MLLNTHTHTHKHMSGCVTTSPEDRTRPKKNELLPGLIL